MLRWRAVSACARVVFPDIISGLYTAEEMGAEVVLDEDGAMQVVHADPPEAPDDGPTRAHVTRHGEQPAGAKPGGTLGARRDHGAPGTAGAPAAEASRSG